MQAHDGRYAISVEEAARVAGISATLAYKLAAQRRFPIFSATPAGAGRERMQVLIETLAQWMRSGGTAQYDGQAEPMAQTARDTRPDWTELRAELAAIAA